MDYSLLFDAHTHFHEGMGEGQKFCLSGYSHKSNAEVLQKIPALENACFSLGLGPQEIQRDDLHPDFEASLQDAILQIEGQKENPLFAAVGEVGLDNHWGKTPEQRFRQFEAFERMISLSKKLGKAIVVHSRDAENECIAQLLAAECKKVMMHCFSGKLEEAKRAADAGFYISIPPLKNKERKKIIKEIDLDYLLVESDAPYLGKKSADAYFSAKMIAEYKNLKIEGVLDSTAQNARKLFGV
ncbi:MAG: TatD family hydrolase [Candidatus Micrarchaeota archaeon]